MCKGNRLQTPRQSGGARTPWFRGWTCHLGRQHRNLRSCQIDQVRPLSGLHNLPTARPSVWPMTGSANNGADEGAAHCAELDGEEASEPERATDCAPFLFVLARVLLPKKLLILNAE